MKLRFYFTKRRHFSFSICCSLARRGEDDEEVINFVIAGTTPSYALESKLGACSFYSARGLAEDNGKALSGLPLEGFNYNSILGQCCKMPVGYVQILVGIAGPLLLDGNEYCVPMATTEGYLVEPMNFEMLAGVFNSSSRFGRLQSIKCAVAGKNLCMRFTCSTGDAMGMNMGSKGVQNVLDFLHSDFLHGCYGHLWLLEYYSL